MPVGVQELRSPWQNHPRVHRPSKVPAGTTGSDSGDPWWPSCATAHVPHQVDSERLVGKEVRETLSPVAPTAMCTHRPHPTKAPRLSWGRGQVAWGWAPCRHPLWPTAGHHAQHSRSDLDSGSPHTQSSAAPVWPSAVPHALGRQEPLPRPGARAGGAEGMSSATWGWCPGPAWAPGLGPVSEQFWMPSSPHAL